MLGHLTLRGVELGGTATYKKLRSAFDKGIVSTPHKVFTLPSAATTATV
ncbi:hypothetical protein ACIBRY_35705 [Streptomyces anulatus]